MADPYPDKSIDVDHQTSLKITYPKGTCVIELSREATRSLAGSLRAADTMEAPVEIELRGPGRYVGSNQLDEHQALVALGQTLGLIERAGFKVLYPDGDGAVYLDEQLHRMTVVRKEP